MTIASRRRALMAVKEKEEGIPSEYQEVTYVAHKSSASNTQILTNIAVPNKYPTIVESKFYMTDYGDYHGHGAGFAKTSGSPAFAIDFERSTKLYVWNGSDIAGITASVQTKIAIVKITINSDGFINEANIAGTDYVQTATATPASWTGNYISIGVPNGNGNMRGRTYYLKVTQQGKVIADLKPCYRKADSVIGMYDLVTRQFFPASGTWTKGADVTP